VPKGDKIEKNILAPAYKAINETIEKIEAMNIGSDSIFDRREKDSIKVLISIIRSELDKLIDLGLYNDSQTKVMRDRAATALRSLSIDLHNNLNETEIALGLAKIAEEISGMESSKNKIQADVDILQKNLDYKTKEDKFNKIIEPIIDKNKSGNSTGALEDINQLIYNSETDSELKGILQEIKQSIEERIVKYGKPIKAAPTMHTINGVGSKIYSDTLYFVVLFIPVFPIARYSLEEHGNGSYNFFGKLELHKWQKYWQYIFIGLIVILILSSMFSG